MGDVHDGGESVFPTNATPRRPLINQGHRMISQGTPYPKRIGRGKLLSAIEGEYPQDEAGGSDFPIVVVLFSPYTCKIQLE